MRQEQRLMNATMIGAMSCRDITLKPTLGEVAAQVANLEADFTEQLAHSQDLRVIDGALFCDGERYELDPDIRKRLFIKARAPLLGGYSVRLQDIALSEHIQRRDFGNDIKLIRRGDRLVTVSRADLIELPCSAVLDAISTELGTDGESLSVARIARDEERLELDLVSPAKAIDVRVGDIVQGGLHIEHTRYGDDAIKIQAFILRLKCSNGMTRRECVPGADITRTRKLAANHPSARALQLNQVRRLARLNWDSLEPQLIELRATN